MDWKEKVFKATQGSQFGAILHCAAGIDIPAPRFIGKATITSDGFVMCSFESASGKTHMGAFVGSSEDILRNVNGLIAHLKLSSADAQSLRDLVSSWIATDYSNNPAFIKHTVQR